ncbi:MAG: cytochrome c [bacterium]|nr:cytochrome c [bacterium]
MKNVLKWIGLGASALILFVLVVFGYFHVSSSNKTSSTYAGIKGKNLYVTADSAAIERGKHLAHGLAGCAGCHGDDLAGMSTDMRPLAMFNVPNITQGVGGLPPDYSVQDLDLVVRHGIKRDKTGVIIMPVYHNNRIADEDIAAIYTYLMSAPKINRKIEPLSLGPIGKMLVARDQVVVMPAVVNHNFKPGARPGIAPTAEYGKYLAEVACMGCHAPNYSGGPVFNGDPSWPPAPNLTTKLDRYTLESFVALLKTGIRPDGTTIDAKAMPVRDTKNADSLEYAALWNYITSLPKVPDASANWKDELMIK